MSRAVVLKPRLSEKVYSQSEELNTYVFDIKKSVNKQDVLNAVKKQYDVTPARVRVASVKGKRVRSVRHGGRSVRKYHRSDIKKAYVTLREGDNLPIFAAVDEKSKKPEAKEKK